MQNYRSYHPYLTAVSLVSKVVFFKSHHRNLKQKVQILVLFVIYGISMDYISKSLKSSCISLIWSMNEN